MKEKATSMYLCISYLDQTPLFLTLAEICNLAWVYYPSRRNLAKPVADLHHFPKRIKLGITSKALSLNLSAVWCVRARTCVLNHMFVVQPKKPTENMHHTTAPKRPKGPVSLHGIEYIGIHDKKGFNKGLLKWLGMKDIRCRHRWEPDLDFNY